MAHGCTQAPSLSQIATVALRCASCVIAFVIANVIGGRPRWLSETAVLVLVALSCVELGVGGTDTPGLYHSSARAARWRARSCVFFRS